MQEVRCDLYRQKEAVVMEPAQPVQSEMEVESMWISWINMKTRVQNNHQWLDQIRLRDSQTGLYNEECFNEFLALEMKRRDQSGGSTLLMLADLSAFTDISERSNIANQ